MDSSPTAALKLGRAIRTLFALGAGTYGLGVSAFVLLRLILDETWLPIAVYNTFAHLLWLGAIPLLVLALLLRTWRAALMLVLPIVAFGVSYGGQFINSTNEPLGSNRFSVLTYNIKWRHWNPDYADVIGVIREADADIVGLQELGENAVPHLEAALADEYPYQALHPHRVGTVGQGFLSRYPIVEDEVWLSEFLPASFMQQRVVLDVNGSELVVYNLHLNHPFIGVGFFNSHQRALQVNDLLDRIEAEQSRVILIGDFNMVDLTEDYARIRERFSDAYFDVGWGLGWTFRFGVAGSERLPPLARIDYVFFDSYGLDAVEAHVWNASGGSDHRPVRAELSIFDPTASYP